MGTCWGSIETRISQVKQPVNNPLHIASHQRVRPRHSHDHYVPPMSLQFAMKNSTLGFLQERSRMSSVLKKRRKKMRKHKYKKLRRRQKFERRKS